MVISKKKKMGRIDIYGCLSTDNPNDNENLKGLVLEAPLILPNPNEVTPLRIWTGKLLSSGSRYSLGTNLKHFILQRGGFLYGVHTPYGVATHTLRRHLTQRFSVIGWLHRQVATHTRSVFQ